MHRPAHEAALSPENSTPTCDEPPGAQPPAPPRWLDSLTAGGIGRRIGLGFAVVIALMLGVTAIGLWSGHVVEARLSRMVLHSYPQSVQGASIREQVHQSSRSMSQLIFLMTMDDKKREKAKVLAARTAAATALKNLADSIVEPGGVALLDAVVAAKKAYDPQVDAFLALIDDNQTEQARDLALPQIAPLEQRYLDALNALIAQQGTEIASAGTQAQSAVADMHGAMLGVSAAAVALAVLIGVFTTRSVTRPLAEAVTIAQCVAEGDLSSQVREGGADETGQLLRALKTMNANLRHIVAKVRSGTDEIAGTSREIQSDCAAILTRTEAQATAIEATAASIEELTSTVALNASNAERANGQMGQTTAIAAEVGQVMSQVVGTMLTIKERSSRIGEIVGVIDGIAFQTNILALNAAVEAARAGEQGRGFAVVAGEVRSLAQRASTASREIRELIQRSVLTVADGNVLVDRAATMVQGMVTATSGVASLVAEITHASQQQHTGIEAFRRSITELDQMAQQNAAFVGQVSDAADSLHRNMDVLVGAVHVFKD